MARHLCFHTYLLFLLLGVVVPFALGGDVTQKGTASVTLTVPHQTLLWDEVVRFMVCLRNDSKENLLYIPDPYEAAGRQVFISVERGDPNFRDVIPIDALPEFQGRRPLRIETDGSWEAVAGATTGMLGPAKTARWDGTRFDSALFYIKLGKPKSIQAQVLIGPGEWVSSKAVSIKVIHTDLSSTPVVFEGFYLSPFRRELRTKVPIRVRRVSIEGREYLFSNAGARICEVPKGCTPLFACDPETAVLTVRFPGTDVPPIRYHYPQMQVLPARPADAPQKR